MQFRLTTCTLSTWRYFWCVSGRREAYLTSQCAWLGGAGGAETARVGRVVRAVLLHFVGGERGKRAVRAALFGSMQTQLLLVVDIVLERNVLCVVVIGCGEAVCTTRNQLRAIHSYYWFGPCWHSISNSTFSPLFSFTQLGHIWPYTHYSPFHTTDSYRSMIAEPVNVFSLRFFIHAMNTGSVGRMIATTRLPRQSSVSY